MSAHPGPNRGQVLARLFASALVAIVVALVGPAGIETSPGAGVNLVTPRLHAVDPETDRERNKEKTNHGGRDRAEVEGMVLSRQCSCGVPQIVIGTLDGPTVVRVMPVAEKDRRNRIDKKSKQRGKDDRIEEDDTFLRCDDLAAGDYVFVNEGVRHHANLWDAYRVSRERTEYAEDTRKDDDPEKGGKHKSLKNPGTDDLDDSDGDKPLRRRKPVRIVGHEDGAEEDEQEEPAEADPGRASLPEAIGPTAPCADEPPS